MDTTTTVATVRGLYQDLASSPEAFLSELNEITSRLLNSDPFKGWTDEVLFATSSATSIVLPRQYAAILGWNRNDVPMPVFGQFHQYIEMGIGWQDPSEMVMNGLIADGTTVTQVEPTGTFTLKVYISNTADAGKIIRFNGKDQNGQPIYTAGTAVSAEGVALTTVNPAAVTTQQFTALTGIQAPSNMLGRWTLWQVIAGAETQIGTYEPGEEFPSYRKYKVGVRGTPDVIRCFCRRQWLKLVAETDWVYPGCLPAIKMAFKALQLENANKYGGANEPNADDQWQRAFDQLDKELAVIRGYEIPSLRMFGGPYPRANYIVN